MSRSFVRRFAVSCVLAVAFLLFRPAPAGAAPCDFVQTVFHDIVPNATIVNIYWSTGWNGAAPSDLTMGAIDAYTQALVDSTYFEPAQANYGTGMPTFGGSIQDATFTPTVGSVDIPYMSNEVNSVLMKPQFSGLTNVVVNLFVPIGTRPRNILNQDCSTNFIAFHTKSNLTSTPFTVIPIDPACLPGGFAGVVDSVSHELVETVTDPGGAGYLHNSDFSSGEVADICQPGGAFPTGTVPFLTGKVDTYFSDGECGCVPSWSDFGTPFEPLKLSLATDGSLKMQMFGGRFGALPARFALPTTSNTPYLRLAVTRGGATFNAGDSVDGGGNPQFVSIATWTNNEVQATVARSFVFMCDSLALQVWDPKGGASEIAHALYGSAATIANLQSTTPAAVGQGQLVTGVVMDTNNIPVSGATVHLAGGTFAPADVATGADGTFATTWTPTTTGTITLTASTTSCAGAVVSSARAVAVLDASSFQCGVGPSKMAGSGAALAAGAGAAMIAFVVRRRRVRQTR